MFIFSGIITTLKLSRLWTVLQTIVRV